MIKKDKKPRIIVSLTSFPARIGFVSKVLDTIYCQTMQPDKVILWLAEEQFPGKERDLSRELTRLVEKRKLTISWCDDLKPHKKYFFVFQEYQDDLVITIDDDILYPSDLIETLYQSYLKNPYAVSAMRVHLMLYDKSKGFLPYNKWLCEYDRCIGKPSFQLHCTGCGGILYPVHLFDNKYLDKEAIKENCLYADDIWLKLMELVNGIPVVLARKHTPLQEIDGSQREGLKYVNYTENDIQLQKSLKWFESKCGGDVIKSRLLTIPEEENLLTVSNLAEENAKRIEYLEQILEDVAHSPSFKIGRFITWPGRLVRDVIRGKNRSLFMSDKCNGK